MKYGYARCSTKHQNIERQVEILKQLGVLDENILIEKESGKINSEDRPVYAVLRSLLRPGDSLVVDALDRLGRNKADIKKEVEFLKNKGVHLIVHNIPTTIMEPTPEQAWISDMILNIIIEVYASFAEIELVEKERRTRAGIELAKKAGKYRGRTPISYDEKKLASIYPRWKSGQVKSSEYMALLGLKPNTFYRAIQKYESTLSEK